MSKLVTTLTAVLLAATPALAGVAQGAADLDLKARVEAATRSFTDVTGAVTVKEKNKAVLVKVDPAFSRVYDFQTATISVKAPDKIRMDSKLGMVKVEYIVAGGKKIFRAPKVRMNKVDDYSKDPAKLQFPIDFGLVTPQLWQYRTVTVVDDPDAKSAGEIKLKLTWPKGNMVNYAWLDEKDLWLKRFEKRDGKDNLLARVVYSNPANPGGVIWMPTKVELFAPDGAKAGSMEFSGLKVNTSLPDSLFK